MGQVEEGTKQAMRLGELASELDAQLTRVTNRVQFVDKLESRLNTLNVMTVDVDRKLAEQLARRSELDTLKSQCDGVIAQMLDAQQKVEAVAALQTKVLPISNRLDVLNGKVEKAQAALKQVQRDEASIAEQEVRLGELVESSRTLAIDTAERMKQQQALHDEVGRSAAVKDELIAELTGIQARQRDAVAQSDAVEDQLRRAEGMYKSLEQRRAQLSFSEKKVAAVEIRMSELAQKSADVDQQIKAITERESVVAAVKAEVESVHLISARSKADLNYVSEHREDVADLPGVSRTT